MPDNATREDFMEYLKGRVKFCLRGVKRDEEGNITTTYEDRENIYRLLLTLNIHLLNLQNQAFNSDSDVYKFPFDVLNSQDWDIEHVDSFHTNALKSEEDKKDWVDAAIEDLKDDLSDKDKNDIVQLMGNKEYDTVIGKLKAIAGEEDLDEETKNGIGNLTLLDAQTNRSYGNSLFCRKRRIIIGRMKQGVFVPVATQYVFSKFFDDKGTNRSKWGKEDMDAYHKYIVEMLKEYLPEADK